MNHLPQYITIPSEMIKLHPTEIKTYLVLRAIAEMHSKALPQFELMAELGSMSNDLMRVSILNLRIAGFLLIPSSLTARQLIDDIDSVPISIVDREMTLDEVMLNDQSFIDFVHSCLNLSSNDKDELVELALNRLKVNAKKIVNYLNR